MCKSVPSCVPCMHLCRNILVNSKSVGIGCDNVTSESISICLLNLRMKLVMDSVSITDKLLRFLRASCLSSKVTGAYMDLNFFRIESPSSVDMP